MYIGETESLARRYKEYLEEKEGKRDRIHVYEMLKKYEGYCWFSYALVPKELIKKVENALHVAFWPPRNKKMPAAIRGAVKLLEL